jgi:3-keto-5-aminohexanoate cleavage enzyme
MASPYSWNYSDPYEYVRRVQSSQMPPLIITVAITGGGNAKEINPNVPEFPEEQAKSAYEAYNAGAASVHIHARDETGATTSSNPVFYREINKRVRDLCPDIIIGNTTGLSPWEPRDNAVKVLEAEPEMCSLNMGPFHAYYLQKKREAPLKGRTEDIQRDDILMVTWKDVERIAKAAAAKGIKPELEIYSPSHFWNMQRLIQNNLIQKPYWMELIMGPNVQFPTVQGFLNMVECVPPDSLWSVIGVGPHQLTLGTISIIMGGHIRVGFEDNLFYRKGEMAKSNAQLVERIVRIARELGREIATPAKAREMLGMSPTPKKY